MGDLLGPAGWRVTRVSILEIILNPFAQDPAYHAFADSRTLLGIPNFWNVVSNLALLISGAWGLVFLAKNSLAGGPLRHVWATFFLGLVLTAFGSGYYHLGPDNASLAWDRLAMTVGFMSLFALVIGEYLSAAWANRLLIFLLLIGAGSVWYWLRTETQGIGDLRPFALVQFLPMLLVPVIMILRREQSDMGPYLVGMMVFYAGAKIVEHYDALIYAAGELMSGHALKHVFAALAGASLLLGLHRRLDD
ncbi:MAG: alkaline phytoceramidase [Gammaproteobacteria bacterium]|nr:alkaline phytoceramidase [Gammaproteobacteria bacterium]